MAERNPDELYSRGFRASTPLRQADQAAAYVGLRRGGLEYDRRGGYRRPEGYAELPAPPGDDDFEEALADHPENDELLAAVVQTAEEKQIQAELSSGAQITINSEIPTRSGPRACESVTS